MTKVLIPREARAGETRVAATPESVKRLKKAGVEVAIEQGAGLAAGFADAAYEAAGATVAAGPSWGDADAVFTVGVPSQAGVAQLKSGALLIGMLAPYASAALAERLASGRVTALAMELVPRISRAQSMDA